MKPKQGWKKEGRSIDYNFRPIASCPLLETSCDSQRVYWPAFMACFSSPKPLIIIVDTVIGKGSFLQETQTSQGMGSNCDELYAPSQKKKNRAIGSSNCGISAPTPYHLNTQPSHCMYHDSYAHHATLERRSKCTIWMHLESLLLCRKLAIRILGYLEALLIKLLAMRLYQGYI